MGPVLPDFLLGSMVLPALFRLCLLAIPSVLCRPFLCPFLLYLLCRFLHPLVSSRQILCLLCPSPVLECHLWASP
eukprot:7827787-Heterocapsa_arctica.AAC.1